MLTSAQRLKPLHERFLPVGHVANAAASPVTAETVTPFLAAIRRLGAPRKRSAKKKPAPAPAASRKRSEKKMPGMHIVPLVASLAATQAAPADAPAPAAIVAEPKPAASETSATANA